MPDSTRPRAGHRSRFGRTNANAYKRTPTKHIPASLIAEAKRLYLHTNVPTGDISALLGIGTHTFHKRLKLSGWPMRSQRIPKDEPAECAAIGVVISPGGDETNGSNFIPPDEAERKALAARLFRLIAQRVATSEHAGEPLADQPASERAEDSRALAGLARTMQIMNMLLKTKKQEADEPDDPAFRSLEELGRAISAHLEDMELQAADGVSGETEGG